MQLEASSNKILLLPISIGLFPFLTPIKNIYEYQPYFLIAILTLLPAYNCLFIHAWKSAALWLQVYTIIFTVNSLFIVLHDNSLADLYRFLNVVFGPLYFLIIFRKYYRNIVTLFTCIVVVYAVIAVLQLNDIASVNLGSPNRVFSVADDFLITGRGVPSLASEPSTYSDILQFMLLSVYVSSYTLQAPIPKAFVLLSVFSLIFLSKSVVFLGLLITAFAIWIPFNFYKCKLRYILTATLVWILLYSTLDRLFVYHDLISSIVAGDFDNLHEVVGSSYTYRATAIFGAPFIMYDYLIGACPKYLLLNECLNDTSGISGLIVKSGSIIFSLSYTLLCFIVLVKTIHYSIRNSFSYGIIACLLLVELMYVSTNSPFFPGYFALLAILLTSNSLRLPKSKPYV